MTYTLTYDLDGGTGVTNHTKVYGTKFTADDLKTPTKNGFTFDGWYNNSSYTTKLTTSLAFDSSTATFAEIGKENTVATIYAKWSANTYNITYQANGGNFTSGSTTSKKVGYEPDSLVLYGTSDIARA